MHCETGAGVCATAHATHALHTKARCHCMEFTTRNSELLDHTHYFWNNLLHLIGEGTTALTQLWKSAGCWEKCLLPPGWCKRELLPRQPTRQEDARQLRRGGRRREAGRRASEKAGRRGGERAGRREGKQASGRQAKIESSPAARIQATRQHNCVGSI